MTLGNDPIGTISLLIQTKHCIANRIELFSHLNDISWFIYTEIAKLIEIFNNRLARSFAFITNAYIYKIVHFPFC